MNYPHRGRNGPGRGRCEGLAMVLPSGRSRVGSVLVRADDFALGPGANSTVRRETDRVLDKVHRAIGEGEIDAAGVVTSESELAEHVAGTAGTRLRQPIRGQGRWAQARVGIYAGRIRRRVRGGNIECSSHVAEATGVERAVCETRDEIGKLKQIGRLLAKSRHLTKESRIARSVRDVGDFNDAFGHEHARPATPAALAREHLAGAGRIEPIE
jgi:hypothetical protein